MTSMPGSDPFTAPPGASAPAPPAPPRPDAVPTAAYLPTEGIAGTELIAYDLNKQGVYLVLDGQRLKKNMNNYVTVPMADGSKAKIKIKGFVPGRPTITLYGRGLTGRVLYKAPKAPALDIVAFVVAMLGAGVFGGGWFGGLVAALAAFGAGIGAAAWLRNANKKTVPRLVLIVGGAVAGVAGAVGLWITIQLL
jgi:hypothetical protein